jgi:SAM-dependent methyltransferase
MPTLVPNNGCPLCQAEQFWRLPFNEKGVDRNEKRLENYEWRLCKRCANAYPVPAPTLTELQAYWDQNRVETSERKITEEVWQARQAQDVLWAGRVYDFVKPFTTPDQSSYLDIACGLGATVEYFQERGWRAEGIDADPNTKEFHLKRNIRSRIGQIENIEELIKFDLISVCHAIYFITEPLRFISRVKALLKPKGMFLVIVSDFSSTLSAGQPGFAHTWYPNQQSLKFLLSQEGFEIIFSKKIRGSILILSRTTTVDTPSQVKSRPLFAYLMHLSQQARYRYLGKPGLTILKKIRNGLRDYKIKP